MYVILTPYVNWHRDSLRSDRENTGKVCGRTGKTQRKHRDSLRSDRENTGNLKIQFEWVPCFTVIGRVLHESEFKMPT